MLVINFSASASIQSVRGLSNEATKPNGEAILAHCSTDQVVILTI